MEKKIYYHDTDCGGVVYYANYLKYLEEARTEYFTEKGASIKSLAEKGILFVVARQEIDYKSPAFYADTLQVLTKFSLITAVKMEVEHRIINQNGLVVCLAKTILVCVDREIKPRHIPEEIKNKLS